MKIFEITDSEFKKYGREITGYNVGPILETLRTSTPLPEGTGYVPEESALQNLPAAKELAKVLYGGMPVQFGWCNGHNTKLNCLEYHRDSEFNLGTEEFILLLAKEDEIENGKLDTSVIKAFHVPAGVLVEVYATTLHYAPCHADAEKGFKVLVALPQGTNTDKPEFTVHSEEDRMLWAKNKWLLAHPDSDEAKDGAWAGLTGENIDLSKQ